MTFQIEGFVNKYDMAGMYLDLLQHDDQEGECGSGKMPYLRLYAEALKGGSCIFKPIL